MVWTSPPAWVPGSKPTASYLDTYIKNNLLALVDRVQAVRKITDESLTSNATLQTDDELKFTAVAGQTYIFDCDILITTTSNAIDIQVAWSFPTGTLSYDVIALVPAATISNDLVLMSTIPAATSGATPISMAAINGNVHARISGSFLCTTGGTVNLMWAQNASTATALTVKAGSWLIATRVAV